MFKQCSNLFAAQKSKSDVFTKKLDVINSENQTVKQALVSAITKMTDMMIHTLPKKESNSAVAAGHGQDEPEQASRKIHKCTDNCAPHCCKIYDD